MKVKQLVSVIGSLFLAVGLNACNNQTGSQSNDNSAYNALNSSNKNADVTTQQWNYTYNSKKLLETAKDPNGNVTRYDYDDSGNLIKITNPLNQTISFSDFTSKGNPQTITDQNGIVSKLTYNSDGFLDSSTTDGAVIKIQYDNEGHVKQTTSPDGVVTNYKYDDAYYLTEVNSPNGTIKYTRDNAGNITNTEILGANDVVYSDQRVYDEINRLLKITTAVSTQSFSYDNDDNIQTSTDGRNNKTSYAYDGLQRLTQITDAKNGASKYAYENDGNIDKPASVTDANGTNTLYAYNGLGNLLSMFSPDSGPHEYTAYDANGNLLQKTDTKGYLIMHSYYTYDALNRPKSITYDVDQTQNTSFTYDNATNAVGRLTKVQNGISSNSYFYDARGNVTSEVQNIGKKDYEIRYAYNKADKLTNIVYPSGVQAVYTYTNGQLNKVMVNGKIVAEINHLPFGPINQIKYGNNITEDIAYNTDYSIKQLSLSNDLLNREYSYYPNGDIKSITGINNYDYDQLRSLTKANNETYSNDKVSNRTQSTINGTTTNYTVEYGRNRIVNSKIGTAETKYEYDGAGNLTKVTPPTGLATNYLYDNLNHLTSVESGDKTLASYQYNALSQRILKTTDNNEITFIYNSAGQLLEERNKQQNTNKDYIYAEGQLIAVTENGQILYIVTDHLNAPQLMMDGNGRQIWSATYTPFGKASVTGNIKFNLRADGQYQDDETGLYYNWYRYYNPDLGRYITSDPLGLTAGMNTYIYVNSNPINFTDPMGLMAGGLIGGVVYENGVFAAGVGGNFSIGGGWFYNTQTNKWTKSGFYSYGAMAGVPGKALQSTYDKSEFSLNQISGVTHGGGGGFWLSNANCVNDLEGPASTFSVNNIPFSKVFKGVPDISAQFSHSSSGIWIFSATVGKGGGFNMSSYQTNTKEWP